MPQTADIRQVALRLLARRDHAIGELARKLRERGFGTDEIKPVLVEFEREGWLSDARFAEVFVRSRIDRGQGPCAFEPSCFSVA
jgi:regulatory protein